MKNIFVYYVANILPLPFLILMPKSGNPNWFVILLMIYAIPYRILIDGARLISLKLLKWSEVWKLLIPGWVRKYRKELYFRK